MINSSNEDVTLWHIDQSFVVFEIGRYNTGRNDASSLCKSLPKFCYNKLCSLAHGQ